eukprot:TRINITY_DN3068_c0_g1_i2.p1 TRINITY_DN3068_c0_g1~~TRINITY_DN3068_c0_g1_i2.p1  ORF type:complete len:472 (+),score=40.07 TRINITY_DN3068_c0_g1_i2:98-1513(+)
MGGATVVGSPSPRKAFCPLLASWFTNNRHDLVCGCTVALATVPSSVGFAFLGGLPPHVGLTGSWIIMLAMALLGTRPGMIYSNAGAVAVVIGPFVASHGVGYAFYVFMLAGFIIMVLGLLNIGRCLRLLPASVLIGFVNGIALLISKAECRAFRKLPSMDWRDGSELELMIPLTIVITAVFLVLYRANPRAPAALISLVISAIIEWAVLRAGVNTSTPLLGDVAPITGSRPLPIPIWLRDDVDLPNFNLALLRDIFPPSLWVSGMVLIESLATARHVSELASVGVHSLKKKAPDLRREAFWVGAANTFLGIFGGQGGCSEMGLTMLNIRSGASTSIAGICAALLTLLSLLVAGPALDRIPLFGYAGVMFAIALSIFQWRSLVVMVACVLPQRARMYVLRKYHTHKMPRVDGLCMMVVTVLAPVIQVGLLRAVGLGCLVAVVGFAWNSATRLTVESTMQPACEEGTCVKVMC